MEWLDFASNVIQIRIQNSNNIFKDLFEAFLWRIYCRKQKFDLYPGEMNRRAFDCLKAFY